MRDLPSDPRPEALTDAGPSKEAWEQAQVYDPAGSEIEPLVCLGPNDIFKGVGATTLKDVGSEYL